ncbi:hypothetical protein L6R52_34315 [Myxococcota bacterium]|nr:hypothetical protein [Myxococcota bacterium]
MTSWHPLLTLSLGVLVAASACTDEVDRAVFEREVGCPAAPAVSLTESRATFEAASAATGGDYRYARQFVSFTGSGARTELRVVAGGVVERHYEAWADETSVITESWTESTAELGSHDTGAPVKTLPELYDVCASDVLTVDEGANTLILSVDCDGILATCGYLPSGCLDDCFSGIWIAEVSFDE